MKETFSRYDFMENGAVVDSETGQAYPDPLTLDYNDLNMTEDPVRDTMNDDKLSVFWSEAEKVYGNTIYDDMVLNLNGVMHKNLVNKGDVIYFPVANDIRASFTKGDI